ncbi:type 1 fimbrial protein [Salmonella enterica]|uniref:Type 1 fimbrial protein n=1 Tax=Salmonella enterica subsp. enterica serovar Shamba TaxID=2565017 RepID=A0A8E6VRT1_SALET|nr:type 1 fimbrial protein [Salmonella enterica]EBP7513368.1 type 1 fimbrial protein [Salmonella enterica]EBP9184928.1 type 1 fimbrial protein [Salmonella enterica]QVS49370.1 type 1 fimbrial protein [Salmonella enterica subsp. enterica serovar Shamba]
MKMIVNKKLALATLICSGLFSATSQAVNIDITGTVVASPCVVNGGNDSLEVNLGDNIQADSLSAGGSSTGWKEFTLRLTACPASTSSFSVAFSGTTDTDATKYLNTGSATNLALELTTQDSATTLSNGTSLENVTIPSGTHAYDLQLRTRAVSKGGVGPGTIVGQVQATFTYQ